MDAAVFFGALEALVLLARSDLFVPTGYLFLVLNDWAGPATRTAGARSEGLTGANEWIGGVERARPRCMLWGQKSLFSGRNRCSSGREGAHERLRASPQQGLDEVTSAPDPLASIRRARVPLAMESARRSPATRDGAVAPGAFTFQMGTDAPEACQQFVPRRPFAGGELRIAPIFR